ncbi:MAG: ABC transporter permease [Gemmatimonadaceae bacterium]
MPWSEWVSEIRGDITYALRRMRQSPGFTVVAVAILALGSGATTAMFSVVYALLLRPVAVPEPERIVRMYETNPQTDAWTTSEPNYLDYRELTKSFTTMGAMSGRPASLTGLGDPIQLNGAAATASIFSIFGSTTLAGSVYGTENDVPGGDTHVVVLSEGIWRRQFGAQRSIVGTSIWLDGVPHRVVGVVPTGYAAQPSDFWVPLAPDPSANRGSHLLTAFAQLKPGVPLAQAQSDISGVARQLAQRYPKSNERWGARLEGFGDFIVGNTLRRQVVFLFAAVALVLLLACTNVANLLLVRATARQREIAVRVALGAGTARLVRQLLRESVVVSLCGAVGGVVIAAALVPVIRAASPFGIARIDEVSLNGTVLAFAIGCAVVTGLLFGLVPALHAIRSDLQLVLRQSGRNVAGSGRSVRSTLIVGEVALATALLIGAGLLGVSFVRLQAVSPGFSDDGVVQLTVTAPNALAKERRFDFFDRLEAALKAVPGVAAVGASSIAPFTGANTATQFLVEGRDASAGDFSVADWRSVTPGLFPTLGIALVRGRLLQPTDRAGTPYVAVIDETMARRLWAGEDPIGHRIVAAQSARGPNDYAEIVGIVRDIEDQTPSADPRAGRVLQRGPEAVG